MAYDKSFISKLEGGRFLEPYAVQDKRAGNSGVTIATGVDLSKQDPATLTDILSQDQINYLQRRNAFTATGVDAISAAESLRGFKISDQQAEALESRIYGTIENKLRERLTEVSGDPNSFDKMTPRQQTAIMSLAINHGPELKYNNGNNYRAIELAAAGDWNGYISELNNFGESLPGLTKRRKQEATYLSEDFKEQEKVKQAEKQKQGRNFTGNVNKS
jgi:hypothetical protein